MNTLRTLCIFNTCSLYIYELHSSYHALARGLLALLQGVHRQGAWQIITLDLLNTIIGDEAAIWSPMTASTHFHNVARKGLSLCETERSVYVVWGSVITW